MVVTAVNVMCSGGDRPQFAAILVNAACTPTCLQLSVALLAVSAGYALTGIGNLDAVGSLLFAILSFREGSEALHKARGLACSCRQ